MLKKYSVLLMMILSNPALSMEIARPAAPAADQADQPQQTCSKKCGKCLNDVYCGRDDDESAGPAYAWVITLACIAAPIMGPLLYYYGPNSSNPSPAPTPATCQPASTRVQLPNDNTNINGTVDMYIKNCGSCDSYNASCLALGSMPGVRTQKDLYNYAKGWLVPACNGNGSESVTFTINNESVAGTNLFSPEAIAQQCRKQELHARKHQLLDLRKQMNRTIKNKQR